LWYPLSGCARKISVGWPYIVVVALQVYAFVMMHPESPHPRTTAIAANKKGEQLRNVL